MAVRTFSCLLVLALIHSAPAWEEFQNAYRTIQEDAELLAMLPQHEVQFQMQTQKSAARVPFPCHVFKAHSTPQSAHALRPADIHVVAAIGDSITAGNGIRAKTVVGVLKQYRGYSWSVGGLDAYEDDAQTLPNILKKYHAGLKGFSVGVGDAQSAEAAMNAAIPGAVASGLPEQAFELVERLRNAPDIDFYQDWKMITLFIGGNDLCKACSHQETFSADQFIYHLENTLDIFHQNLPRALINVAPMFDLTPLGGIKGQLICKTLHKTLCPCGILGEHREYTRHLKMEYSQRLDSLINTRAKYDSRADFTVVYQPFMLDNDVPRTEQGDIDLDYMAPDCFHFSQKGHNSISRFLWNGMFQRVGHKSRSADYNVELYCPLEHEYVATRGNSDLLAPMHNSLLAGIHISHKEPHDFPASSTSGFLSSKVFLCVLLAAIAVLLLVLVAMAVVSARSRGIQLRGYKDLKTQSVAASTV